MKIIRDIIKNIRHLFQIIRLIVFSNSSMGNVSPQARRLFRMKIFLKNVTCCMSVGLRISVKNCKEKGGKTDCRIKQILLLLHYKLALNTGAICLLSDYHTFNSIA